MCSTAANLVTHVLPLVPLRQWVLTFPWSWRKRLAYDAELLGALMSRFVKTVHEHYARRLAKDGLPGGTSGSVAVIQRTSSDLRCNPHVHAVFLDGVHRVLGDHVAFHGLGHLQTREVQDVLERTVTRMTRYLDKRGLLQGDGDGSRELADDLPAGTPEPEAEGSPTTLPVKGAGGKLRGVEVTSGMFAVPTAEVGTGTTDRTVRSPDGTDHGSERIAEVPGLGVTILSSSGKPTRCTYMLLYDENEFRYLLRAGSLKVRDRSGAVLTVNGSIVIDPQDNGLIPLDVNGELDAVGVLLGPDDQTLGVVAEIRHSTVALLLPAVEKVICDA